jgi:hypothetical protein
MLRYVPWHDCLALVTLLFDHYRGPFMQYYFFCHVSTGGLVEQLTEIIIRCSGDHFTLLRPLHQDQGGQQPSGGYRVRTLRLSCSTMVALWL